MSFTGRLTRLDWDYRSPANNDRAYTRLGRQPVQLQFKKSGAAGWGTVKTIWSKTGGRLSSTATAEQGGTWRFTFAGNASVASVAPAGDWVQVR